MEREEEKRTERRTLENPGSGQTIDGEDLLVEILHRLPLKSIIQCLCVCKQWRSLFSNPCPTVSEKWRTLISHNPSLHSNLFLVAVAGGGSAQSIILTKSPNFEGRFMGRMSELRSESSSNFLVVNYLLNDFNVIAASCNGLIFSIFHDPRESWAELCYISNPWTRQHVRLPNPSSLFLCLFGLTFEGGDSPETTIRSTYNIVIAHQIYHSHELSYRFEIYSSKEEAWRWIDKASNRHRYDILDPMSRSAVYCYGILHWLCTVNHSLFFDPKLETSGYLAMPSCCDDDDKETRLECRQHAGRLAECHDELHYTRVCSYSRQLKIWKMSLTAAGSYNSWLLLHSVDLETAVERNIELFGMDRGEESSSKFPSLYPLDMICGGEDKVLLYKGSGGTVSYDLKSGEFELMFGQELIPRSGFFRYTPNAKFLL